MGKNMILKVFVQAEYTEQTISRGLKNTMTGEERKMLLENMEKIDIISLARDICHSVFSGMSIGRWLYAGGNMKLPTAEVLRVEGGG